MSDSPNILIICVTFHCLIFLLMLGALNGNKEFVSYLVQTIHVMRYKQNAHLSHEKYLGDK